MINRAIIRHKLGSYLKQPNFWLLIFFLTAAALTRFIFLKESATFFWDQAYDLSQIYDFYQEKRITLIGPISEGGDKVFGSLTYYMLLPFAVIGNFSAASTTYGAAFYGLVTAVALVYLMYLINKKSWLAVAVLACIWFPLIETSRMAWNPNLLLFWISLGLILFQKNTKATLFLSGLFLGLSIHNHYFSFVATASFIFLNLVINYKNKEQLLKLLWMVAGYGLAILPFVAFDITHPPGLFITRIVLFDQNQESKTLLTILADFVTNTFSVLRYYTINKILAFLLLGYLFILMYFDYLKNKKYLIYISTWFLQILAVSFINQSFSHYFLPGLVFFLIYLFLPRKIPKLNTVLVSSLILIIGSVFTIIPQITTQQFTKPDWKPNINTVEAITDILYQEINDQNLEGVNLAVLGSSDPNRYGWKYRSLLKIRGITLKSKEEYFTNNYLFVVSQQSEQNLRKDPSPEMERFRREKLVKSWQANNSGWYIYLFSF